MVRSAHWLSRTLIAGFIATALAGIVLLLAYAISSAIGPLVPGTLGQWMVVLAANQATTAVQAFLPAALLLHICVGLVFAVIYATYAEPVLTGSGWRRGALFALVPYILSVTIFLPVVGGGFLGMSLGAGPLPLIGNFVLHMIYGVTLGTVYALDPEVVASLPSPAMPGVNRTANLLAEDGFAMGMVVVGVLGALVGLFLSLLNIVNASAIVAVLSGAILGAVAGALVGSFAGMSRAPDHPA